METSQNIEPQSPDRRSSAPVPAASVGGLLPAPAENVPEGRRPGIRGPLLAGIGAVAFFFVGLGTWSVLTPLAGAAIAPGVVSPEGSRRTIQHLEGGIISDILVSDGTIVQAGDPLVVLEEVQARAEFEMMQDRHRALMARQSRLQAERDGDDAVTFPEVLRDAMDDPIVAEITRAEVDLFESRRAELTNRRSIIGQRIAQLNEEVIGLEAQIESLIIQAGLIGEEISGVQRLYDQGLERRARLLALQRTQAEIEGRRAELLASIARSGQAIGEADLQILNMDAARRDEVVSELNEIRTELAAVEDRRRASEDVLTRTIAVSPINGTVVQLRFRTVGGVIGPGEPILDVVPLEEDMIIDARLSPQDIDTVTVGQTAQVIFPAYRQRNLPRIEGSVNYLSPDSIVDQQTGQSYFAAKIEVDRDELEDVAPNISLTPGMVAEVMVMTEERTVFDYLIGPFLDSLRRTFRDT